MYRILRNVVISDVIPQNPDVLWLRPVDGGFALYYHTNGEWKVLRVMNDEGTSDPNDDKPYDLDAIGASKLSQLEDVEIDEVTMGQILKYNGSIWENGNDDTGTPGPDTVGTEQIIDNSVELEDLNDRVKDKIQKTYDISDESLSMDFDVTP